MCMHWRRLRRPLAGLEPQNLFHFLSACACSAAAGSRVCLHIALMAALSAERGYVRAWRSWPRRTRAKAPPPAAGCGPQTAPNPPRRPPAASEDSRIGCGLRPDFGLFHSVYPSDPISRVFSLRLSLSRVSPLNLDSRKEAVHKCCQRRGSCVCVCV
jgi:hypothetical protein